MRLTIKNIRDEMAKLERCAICGGRAELGVRGNLKEYQVFGLCCDCGATFDFGDWLIAIEGITAAGRREYDDTGTTGRD